MEARPEPRLGSSSTSSTHGSSAGSPPQSLWPLAPVPSGGEIIWGYVMAARTQRAQRAAQVSEVGALDVRRQVRQERI